MTDRLHTCVARECDKQISSQLLMCIAHWRMVPKALQREIYRTYRVWSRAPLGEGLASRALYRDAVRLAIAAVRDKEIKRQLRKDSTGDVLNLE